MAAEQLQLRTDDPVLRQIGEQLMPEEMRVHAFRDPSRHGIPFDNLAETPRRVGLTPPRFKQVYGSLGTLSVNILREFSTEVGRKEDIAIFVPFALVNPQVTRLQIHIGEAKPDEFRVADAGIQEQFQHHQMGELLGMPDCLIKRDEFSLGQEVW
jgi:hypothetical protein